jgi:hypothetical protein
MEFSVWAHWETTNVCPRNKPVLRCIDFCLHLLSTYMKNEYLIGTLKKQEKCAYFDQKNQILSIIKVIHVVWIQNPVRIHLYGLWK